MAVSRTRVDRLSIGVAVACIALAAALLGGCGGSSGEGSGSSGEKTTADFDGSGYPGVDAANTRRVAGTIDSANVSRLAPAWRASIPGIGAFGRYASTPVIAKGVIYSQDLASNVQALSLRSGRVLWSKRFDEPTYGPNGVVVAAGLVFGPTPTGAFALDEETGKEVWSTKLTRNEHEGVNIAPGYGDGQVYLSTSPVNGAEYYEGGGVGTLWALDAKTGEKKWHFDTVPRSLWGNPKVNSGGGAWYPPALDDAGSLYFGIGNPAPLVGTKSRPYGSSRPGPDLYTDSLLKLDAKTGKLDWYHQVTPHDIYDWDFQGPPMLLKAGGRELVVAAGKSGIVIAADPKSGKIVWEAKVGKHNGHDEDGLLAMHGEEAKIGAPATVYPGSVGGVIAPMSTDGKLIFAPVVNRAQEIVSGSEKQEPEADSGEVVALDAASGKVVWTRKVPSPAFGATTVVNDVVFATDEEGHLFALDAASGRILWRRQLPAGTNAGAMVSGDTVVAPAGLAAEVGQRSEIVGYRLAG